MGVIIELPPSKLFLANPSACWAAMEAFYRTANYPVVKHSDMSAEVREEALDICLLACEKHAADMEKCTQACPSLLCWTAPCACSCAVPLC